MLLFIKSFIVGIGKIMPGVSGALLAINFNIYEKLLDSLTNFFSNWKTNLKFILIFFSGVILSIVLCSRLLLYFLTNYRFITMMFFIGLIIGGTYNFGTNLKYNKSTIIIIITLALLFLTLSIISPNNTYYIKNNIFDSIIFFLGGYIDIFASILPGISGTSLLMIMGIYHEVLKIISNTLNLSYIINHLNLYFSYGVGMLLSLIINTYLINYLIKKHRSITYAIVLGLSLSSIIFLIIMTFKIPFNLIELIIGIMILVVGILLSCILDK